MRCLISFLPLFMHLFNALIMKHLLLLLIIFCLAQHSISQAPGIHWQNSIGGSMSDALYAAFQTDDGGYFLAGNSNSNISPDKSENSKGGTDFWVLKLDTFGNIQWQKTIGGSFTDRMSKAQPTSDGGVILGGTSSSNISGDKTEDSQGMSDYWVVKLDVDGNILWQNTIGGSGFDELHSVQQTTDGGYIIGGYSGSNTSGDKTEDNIGVFDYWVVKLDSTGSIEWENTIGGADWDELNIVRQTSDGGYIVGGQSASNISGDKTENNTSGAQNNVDYWVLKLDAMGNIQWQNTIGGIYTDMLLSVEETADNGYILAGWSNSPISGDKTANAKGEEDCWIIKLDAVGNIKWQKTIGGNKRDIPYSIEQLPTGDFLMSGWSGSGISGDKTEICRGGLDYWLIRLNASGDIIWQKTIGGSYDDALYSAQLTHDGGYILAGATESNASGDKTENGQGDFDYWVVKLLPDLSVKSTEPFLISNLSAFPSPFSNDLLLSMENIAQNSLTLRFFDINGVLAAECNWPAGTESMHISTGEWQPGVYFVQVRNAAGGIICTQKLVKVK